ncbi:MAG: hypothetical protein ACE5ER_01335 [Nitrospinaceae bacterium]
MSDIKLVELAEAPAEGAGKQINMVHPLTEYPYQLGLFHIKDRYFVVTDHLGDRQTERNVCPLFYGRSSLER